MIDITAKNITIKYSKQTILDDLSLKLMDGKITAILGPNGSGKSTLLKTLVGLTPHNSGHVIINNQNITSINKKELAKILSILPQSPDSPYDISIKQLVSYGRHAHSSLFKNTKNDDDFYINWALETTNLSQLANRSLNELSGGQRQRAWIAMSLAQNSKYLFLDEPTTYLDIRYQFEVMSLLKNLNKNQNKTIIMVLHELQNAINYADQIIILDQGKIIANDATENILGTTVLEDVFKIKIKRVFDDEHKLHTVICDQHYS